ncbi:hypothetical protein EMCG_05694 [[Emmonsia] crescens]|uniref:Uncharacterized protein n=1 Tax=[Emmonsia] crescens TaxID=73230 RepID=A0A0G2JC67_9EURO|nr:hypothetical protein EMCG_05694 [Emmonsia crescens UAMH 3008]
MSSKLCLSCTAVAAAASEQQELLNQELRGHVQMAMEEAREACPKNTVAQYDRCQEEWKMFCHEKGFQDGELVTEEKLVFFLRTCVLGREYKPNQRSRNRTNQDGEIIVQTIGHPTVRAYRSVIVNLWSYQQSCCTNLHPHPVEHAAKALLKINCRQEDKRKRAEFVD